MSDLNPTRGPVEKKVRAGTVGAGVGAFVVWLLAEYVFGHEVPEPVVALVYVVVPGIVAFVSGYIAQHTPRPDKGQA